MSFYRSGFGFSAPLSHSAQRYCYVKPAALDQLLATPGMLELLLVEVTGELEQPRSIVEQLARLKRRAIHLSVTRSAFHGLSLEEIIVLCAYTSPRFEHTPFQRELLAEPRPEELWASCRLWLRERAACIAPGEALQLRHWPLVGHTPQDHQTPSRFAVGLAPITHSAVLDRELGHLASEAGFAHEHYVACTPATALDYVRRAAAVGGAVRWDPFALDRRLRSLGLGLLLVEGTNVVLYLPARYHSSPAGALAVGS